eukprot:jgi/Mesvir1/15233/Mv06459-RA.1
MNSPESKRRGGNAAAREGNSPGLLSMLAAAEQIELRSKRSQSEAASTPPKRIRSRENGTASPVAARTAPTDASPRTSSPSAPKPSTLPQSASANPSSRKSLRSPRAPATRIAVAQTPTPAPASHATAARTPTPVKSRLESPTKGASLTPTKGASLSPTKGASSTPMKGGSLTPSTPLHLRRHSLGDEEPYVEFSSPPLKTARAVEIAESAEQMTPRSKALAVAYAHFLERQHYKAVFREYVIDPVPCLRCPIREPLICLTRRCIRRVPLEDVHPQALIGRKMQIYWPLDDIWYDGQIGTYDGSKKKHLIHYVDGESEWLDVGKERFQLYLTPGEELPHVTGGTSKPLPAGEGAAHGGRGSGQSAATISVGDTVWGVMKGYPAWPGIVLDPVLAVDLGAITKAPGQGAAHVIQFFSTYEVAWIRHANLSPFLDGLKKRFHNKAKSATFLKALTEATTWLQTGVLPEMMKTWNDIGEGKDVDGSDDGGLDALGEGMGGADAVVGEGDSALGRISIVSLGTLLPDNPAFCTKDVLIPFGFKALHMLPANDGSDDGVPLVFEISSTAALAANSPSKKQAKPAPNAKPGSADGKGKEAQTSPPHAPQASAATAPPAPARDTPVFLVSTVGGFKVKGSSAAEAVKAVVREAQRQQGLDASKSASTSAKLGATAGKSGAAATKSHKKGATKKSGAAPPPPASSAKGGGPQGPFARLDLSRIGQHAPEVVFGHGDPRVAALVQALPGAAQCAGFKGWIGGVPLPTECVEILWERSDQCSVCLRDEEVDDNYMLQCDSCRIMVHMQCYGEQRPPDGSPWMCARCLLGSAVSPHVRCCVCPVLGGALKPTSDFRWVHVACALWVPELFFDDAERLEGITGVDKIDKSRYKLKCSVCRLQGVGVCIQCEERTCYAAFHPLCCLGAGYFMEVVETAVGAAGSGGGRRSHKKPRQSLEPSSSSGGEAKETVLARHAYCPRHHAVARRETPWTPVDKFSLNKLMGSRVSGSAAGGASTAGSGTINGAGNQGSLNGAKEPAKVTTAGTHAGGVRAGTAGVGKLAPVTRCPVDNKRGATEGGAGGGEETTCMTAHGRGVKRSASPLRGGSLSGCARAAPFSEAMRKGKRAPVSEEEWFSYIEKVPYVVNGRRHAPRLLPPQVPWSCLAPSPEMAAAAAGASGARERELGGHEHGGGVGMSGPPGKVTAAAASALGMCVADRFRRMQGTLHQRLTFGKSAIHGWGVFPKHPHIKGDMLIEYVGDLVRGAVADLRERRSYNSLVGAGTYMFRVTDDRVVDATHAGSIAHLINHSCEPNCYSRIVTVDGIDHICICALKDIAAWEELCYDYRFHSEDERLQCNCGAAKCRGTVNIDDPDDKAEPLIVSKTKLRIVGPC